MTEAVEATQVLDAGRRIRKKKREKRKLKKQKAKQKHPVVRKKIPETEDTLRLLSLFCPKCKTPLLDGNRLKSRPKLSPKMQKLICRIKRGESLTVYQQKLAQKALQQKNTLVLKCTSCVWTSKRNLQTRQAHQRQKDSFILQQERQKLEQEAEVAAVMDEKAKRKAKKKRMAEKKALECSLVRTPRGGNAATPSASPCQQSSAASSPSSTAQPFATPTSRPVADEVVTPGKQAQNTLIITPTAQKTPSITKTALNTPVFTKTVQNTPVIMKTVPKTPIITKTSQGKATSNAQLSYSAPQTGRERRKGKERLQKALNQRKKEAPSAGESLMTFLNSLS